MIGWRSAAGALIFALSLPACGGTAPPAREPPAKQAGMRCALPATDPLCSMNDAFHEAYAARRTAMLAASGPAILQLGDRLVLVRRGQRLEALTTNARYHELKSVAHVPFAVYLLLAPGGGSLSAAQIQKLSSYRALVRRAAGTIDGRFAGGPLRDRQRRILDRSLALLDRSIAQKRVEAGALRDFVHLQRADLLDDIRDAAREQVTITHALVSAWTARMSAAERSSLRVVVGTVHMARPGNLSVQYFQAWLGEPYGGRRADERVEESERIVVTEGTFDEERALALLGAHLVDRSAAAAFFEDSLRLDRDLLSDGAEEAIREVLGRAPDLAAR